LVKVSESVTEYRFDQTFLNNNEFPVTGVYIFPLDAHALEGAPEFSVDGVSAAMDRIAATDFFPQLRRLAKGVADPAVLESAGKDVFYARGVHMSPKSQKTFRLKFRVPTVVKGEALNLTVTTAGERYAVAPVAELDIRVRFKMSRPVRRVFSTTHHPAVVSESPFRCAAVLRLEQGKMLTDFRLTALFSGGGLDVRTLSRDMPGEGRYFMVCATAPVGAKQELSPAAQVVFVVDKSGSMGERRIGEAMAALSVFLDRLRPGDKIGVVTVGTRASKFSQSLMLAAPETTAEAFEFAATAPSGGGTDLYNALAAAWDILGPGARNGIIILLSDGRPTVGVCDPKTLTEHVKKWHARTKARIFALPIGESPDYALLDTLASSTKGVMARVEGNSVLRAAQELPAFSSPTAALDLSLEVTGLKDLEMFPANGALSLSEGAAYALGRGAFEASEDARVALRGSVKGKKTVITRRVFENEPAQELEDLPALWAMRKYAALWEAHRSGIGTKSVDMTTLNETADELGFRRPWPVRNSRSPSSRILDGQGGALLWKLRRSLAAADALCESCRLVKGRIFRSVNGQWIDTRVKPDASVRETAFLSDDYFALVEESPELGAFFALGPEVAVASPKGTLRVKASP
jgi:Ca-activated chloride channel family protein